MEEPIEIPYEDRQLIEDIWSLIQGLMDAGRASELSEVGDAISHRRINLYPSDSKGPCYPVAAFLSLRSIQKSKKGRYVAFYLIMEKLIQHMQGKCAGVTEKALIYTDDWKGDIYEDWKPNIERIRRVGARIYFIQVIDNSYTILNA